MSGFRWLAWGAEGVAHAVPARGRIVRTACGLAASGLAERMSRPERSRCPACQLRLGFLPYTEPRPEPQGGDAA